MHKSDQESVEESDEGPAARSTRTRSKSPVDIDKAAAKRKVAPSCLQPLAPYAPAAPADRSAPYAPAARALRSHRSLPTLPPLASYYPAARSAPYTSQHPLIPLIQQEPLSMGSSSARCT